MNYDWIKTRSFFNRNDVAVIDPNKGTEWTYEQMNIRAENLANYLRDQGIERGDVFGLFAPNDVSHFDFIFAATKLGAVYLPLNWRLKPQEIAGVVEDSGVKIIFYATNHLERLEKVPQELIHMNVDTDEYNDIVDPSTHRPIESVEVEGDDLLSLMYTSGTTGRPKGVMFTYDTLNHNMINEATTVGIESTDVTIAGAPMFHVLGYNDLTLTLLFAGGTVVIERYFDGVEVNEFIQKYKPTVNVFIPTMYYAMLMSENFNPSQFSQVKFLIQGGSAPLPPVQKKFQEMGLTIQNAYGLTEAPVTFVNPVENAKVKPMSIGRALMFIDYRIINDDGKDVATGEVGELALSGRNVTPGYYNNPEETEKAFTEDGFFRTGDLARVDEEGDIFIVDRKKELIITGGENVLPSEVQNILAQHPLVRQGLVVGYDNPKFGESVSAAVILNEPDPDFEEKLDRYMSENLAGYKTPKLYLELEELPLNSTNKPDVLEVQRLMNAKAREIGQHEELGL